MSLSIEMGRPVGQSLLPSFLLQEVQQEPTEYQIKEREALGEEYVSAVALLVVNTVLGALKALKLQNYVALDANPGDGGCQNRALELRRIVRLDLSAECDELEKAASAVKLMVTRRKGNVKEMSKCSVQTFFRTQVGGLKVSKNMEYILHCFLSKVLRTPHAELPSGVVMTKSEMSKLSTLSNKIHFLDSDVRRKIVEENQKTLSLLTMEALRRSALEITLLKGAEKELLVTMLSPDHTKIYSPSALYEPKAFGVLFYCVKAVVTRLREERAIVCIRSIVPKGRESFDLYLQSCEAGEDLVPVQELVPKSTLITVFEVVASGNREETAALIAKHGFTNIVLAQAATVPQYEPSSKLEEVKVKEAVDEIMAFKQLSEKIGSGIELDHIYTTKKES